MRTSEAVELAMRIGEELDESWVNVPLCSTRDLQSWTLKQGPEASPLLKVVSTSNAESELERETAQPVKCWKVQDEAEILESLIKKLPEVADLKSLKVLDKQSNSL
jgi:hypothetical protein